MSRFKNKYSQFLRKEKIEVTIIDVYNPSQFIMKESPSSHMSEDAKMFLKMEEEMQIYYSIVDSSNPIGISLNLVVVVEQNTKYYRAQVNRVVNSTRGMFVRVFFLDYGKEHDIERNRIFDIKKEFEIVPFQAIKFNLLCLEPMTLLVDANQQRCSLGKTYKWDESIEREVRHLHSGYSSAQIEVYGIPKESESDNEIATVYGTLYVTIDHNFLCFNDELVKQNYAAFNNDLLKSIISIDKILSDNNVVSSHKSGKLNFESQTCEQKQTPPKSKYDTKEIADKIHHSMLNQMVQIGHPQIESLINKLSFVERKDEALQANFCCYKEESSILKKTNTAIQENLNRTLKTSNTNTNVLTDASKKAYACGSSSTVALKLDVRQKLNKLQGRKCLGMKSSTPINASKNGNQTSALISKNGSLESDDQQCDSEPQVVQLRKQFNESFSVDTQNDRLKVSSFQSNSSYTEEDILTPSPNSNTKVSDVNKSPANNQQKLDVRQKLLKFQSPKSTIKDQSVVKHHFHEKCNLDPYYENKESFCDLESFPQVDISYSHSQDQRSQYPCDKSVLEEIMENSMQVDNILVASTSSRSIDYNTTISSQISFPTLNNSEQQESHVSDDDETFDKRINEVLLNSPQDVSDEILEWDSDDIVDSTPNHLPKEKLSQPMNDIFHESIEKNTMPRYISIESEPFFKTEMCFSNKSLWEKLEVPALCLGEDIPKPVLGIDKTLFSSKLCKILDEVKFAGPSCIQSVVWPAMFRNRSLVAVAPPHSGKTLAYLLPILSDFTQGAYDHLPTSNGPILIIVCSSWPKVLEMLHHCRLFLRNLKVKIISLCKDGSNKKEQELSLFTGCDILISTTSCLIEMLQSCATNFERLCHFVFDDGNCVMTDQCAELMKLVAKTLEGRTNLPILQIVFCLERWTRSAAGFVKTFLPDPLIFFTSFLESAVYARIPISTHVCKNSDKKRVLLKILENIRKTVICVSDISLASEVHNFLKHEGMQTFLVNESLEHYNADGVLRNWKSMHSSLNASCLVITDASLISMRISDAECLIHFDVPEISRIPFSYRFSCIAEHFSKKTDEGAATCECHIIVSDDCRVQVPSLVQILRRTQCEIPSDLKALQLKQQQLSVDDTVPLCHYFKAFGRCRKPQCEWRHDVRERDRPTAVVCEGDVVANVRHIFDASHFCVRILKYIDPTSKKTFSLSSEYAESAFALKQFYSDPSNRVQVQCPIVRKDYVLQEGGDLFYRVRILDIETDSVCKRTKYKLFYLDDGYVKEDHFTSMYELSDNIQLPPPLAVEVYLCNVSTPDSCQDWHPNTSQFVCDLINHQDIIGKIVLCLNETLWLYPIALRKVLPTLKEQLNIMRIDRVLKDKGCARDNSNHVLTLRKACDEKVPLPQETVPDPYLYSSDNFEDIKQPVKTNYAFLECGVEEDVYVSSVVTPHEFYVQRAKFADCLDELVDEINAKMEKKEFKKLLPLQKGMHCIALFPDDNRFYRANITDITKLVSLFYVDFGDTAAVPKDAIYALPPEMLRLPFQAIQCELDGVDVPHGGFTEKAQQIMCDLTRNSADDMIRVPLKALSMTMQCCTGNHYLVDMFVDDRSLSDLLLQEGLVNPSERWVLEEVAQHPPRPLIPEEPSGYALSDDEQLEEEKEAAALFCAVLSGMLTREQVAQYGASKTARVVSIREVEGDKEADQPELSTLPEVSTVSAVESSSVKPRIMWWNNMEKVYLSILLKNVQEYDLDTFDDKVVFSTVKKNKFYKTIEVLFAEVNAAETKIECVPHSINIVLTKKVAQKWPRLTQDCKKVFHIKYDLNHLDSESDSDDEHLRFEPMSNLPCENSSSSSSEESTEEEEKFVSPWTQSAEYRDPFDLFS